MSLVEEMDMSSGQESSDFSDSDGDDREQKHERSKRRQRSRKEREILGVFGEGSSDDDRPVSGGRASHFSQGVSFVQSATKPASSEEEEEEPEDDKDNNYGGRPSFSQAEGGKPGLGAFRTQGSRQQSEANAPSLPATFGSTKRTQSSRKAAAQAQSSDTSQQFASWDRAGKASRMMAKMGYKPGTGLGSTGQGTAEHIEVVIRPKGQGIAFRGFREKSKQTIAYEGGEENISSRPKSSTKDGSFQAPSSPADAWKKPTPSSSHGRAAAPKKRKVYVAVEDMVRERMREDTGSIRAEAKIIDLTGQEAREVTASEIRSTPTGHAQSALLPELRFNARYLRDLAETDIREKVGTMAKGRERAEKEAAEAATLRASIIEDNRAIQRIKDVRDILHSAAQHLLGRTRGSVEGEGWLADIEGDWSKLLLEYPEEWRSHRLDGAVASSLGTLLREDFLPEWQPLLNPRAFLPLFLRWRPYLPSCENEKGAAAQGDQVQNLDEAERSNSLFATLSWANREARDRMLHARGSGTAPLMTPYETILKALWLPPVRAAISNDWNPRDPTPAVDLLNAWKPPLIPQFIHEEVCEHLLLPKIRHALDAWRPKKDPVPVHEWLHPWLDTLPPTALEELFLAVRHKLSILLNAWHPSDPSARTLLLPWLHVWSERDMEGLLVESILPKLAGALGEELIIDPAAQDMEAFHWVTPWIGLISARKIGDLFAQRFFPKWLRTLEAWLGASPNYEEIHAWYLWWKDVFMKVALIEEPAIQEGFRAALDIMNRTL